MRRGGASRAVHAAGILAVALVGLLAAWFVSGWSEVSARQREVRAAPRVAADQRGEQIASELHAELEQLLARESDRPYFHYQSVFHDPRSSVSWSVAPSPLATPPENRLVLGYFQIDGHGRASTPTINPDVPALTEPTHRAANVAFLTDVQRTLALPLTPTPTKSVEAVAVAGAGAQVVRIDPSTYVQNTVGNSAYYVQQAHSPPPAPSTTGGTQVTVTVSAFVWRTLPFAAAPGLVAVRQVNTPDGVLEQGFVVDRATLASWLAAHAGDLIVTARPARELDGAPEIASGWRLSSAPDPHAVEVAEAGASRVARDFLIMFAVVALIAMLAGVFVVVVVVRAERLARERSQFAAAAAHELRTPLAGIQLYGDMLADGLGDPTKARDYARRMSEEAARLGRVVSNVLGFSQLERGNLSVHPEVGPIGAAISELADRVRPALDRAGAELVLDVDPDALARFDPDALARIVGNLLDNAEKYARGAEDRSITLATKPRADAIEVVVTDRGPGLARATQAFLPFARGVTADGPAGLGLGLALSQSLARAMGGELEYGDADGGGARFTLVLPLA